MYLFDLFGKCPKLSGKTRLAKIFGGQGKEWEIKTTRYTSEVNHLPGLNAAYQV